MAKSTPLAVGGSELTGLGSSPATAAREATAPLLPAILRPPAPNTAAPTAESPVKARNFRLPMLCAPMAEPAEALGWSSIHNKPSSTARPMAVAAITGTASPNPPTRSARVATTPSTPIISAPITTGRRRPPERAPTRIPARASATTMPIPNTFLSLRPNVEMAQRSIPRGTLSITAPATAVMGDGRSMRAATNSPAPSPKAMAARPARPRYRTRGGASLTPP